jgi:hypothetical protein
MERDMALKSIKIRNLGIKLQKFTFSLTHNYNIATL